MGYNQNSGADGAEEDSLVPNSFVGPVTVLSQPLLHTYHDSHPEYFIERSGSLGHVGIPIGEA
jgi:hypothetical protein